MQLRYGMNPHQDGSFTLPAGNPEAIRVISGAPSYINLLDALNGWQLVREAAAATGTAAAASIKHVSPAGLAVAGQLDPAMRATWRAHAIPGALTSAYIRARDGDPRSSFGDMIAVSEAVDGELAAFLRGVAADGIIAPGFEPGVVGELAPKKRGSFLILEADPSYQPAGPEQRDVFGVLLEQQRDVVRLTADLLTGRAGAALPPATARDAMLGLAVTRYAQSNSAVLMSGGATLAVAAGQQSRIDCVRLAAAKAATWWLRRHPAIAGLPVVPGMSRQDRINWQVRLAENDMTPRQLAEFGGLFPGTAQLGLADRAAWLSKLTGLTLVSDGSLPFRDNVDYASRVGVGCIVEPGGSTRSAEVAAACAEYGIALVRTGLRLFRH